MPIRAMKIRGTVPELSNVAVAVKRASMPRLVKVVAKSAQDEAPKGRGFGSKKSIVSRIGGKAQPDGNRGVVWSKAPHSKLIEFGTDAHPLQLRKSQKSGRVYKKRNRKQAMTIFGPGSGILRKSAQHPGSAADPYMERAIPGARTEIKVVLVQESGKALADSVKDVKEVFGSVAGGLL